MSSQKPHSSERVPKMLTDGRLAEWDQNRTERIENGYGTDTERVGKGYRTGMGMRVERQQNAFCQAFPVRFLLIGTVCDVVVIGHHRRVNAPTIHAPSHSGPPRGHQLEL